MANTTIKVSVELRDRLARLAEQQNTTLAGAIERSIDKADEAQFWADVRTKMGSASERGRLRDEPENYAPALTDGLEPDEDWSDLL